MLFSVRNKLLTNLDPIYRDIETVTDDAVVHENKMSLIKAISLNQAC